jgi:hypothetical protein
MKSSMAFLIFLAPFISITQTEISDHDSLNSEPSYSLNIPDGWGTERFQFPISFAPQIPYIGIEELRFKPGWGKSESDDYWTYAFLWCLDGFEKTNSTIIEKNLNIYYSGLVKVMKSDSSVFNSVKSVIKKVKTQKGDSKTFQGLIYSFDYMANKPITLYCKVHLKMCEGKNKTYLFYEISPKPFNELIWQGIDALWTDFKCDVKLE